MKTLLSILRYTWVTAWYAFAGVAVLLAVLFSTARLMLPHAEEYRSEIQTQLSDFIGQPAKIETLDAEWRGLAPSLVLRNVRLLDPRGESAVLELQKIRVGVDLLATLLQRKVVFTGITLVGLDLTLTKFVDGRIAMQGLRRGGEQRQDLHTVTDWLFSQRELRLEDSDFTWIDQRISGAPELLLTEVNILLRNDGLQHWLDVSLSLPEGAGQSLSLSVDMLGDPMAPAAGRRTRLYAKGEDINFARLLPGLDLGGVRVDVESSDFQLWMDWLDGDLQGVEGTLGLTDMTLATGQGQQRLERHVDEMAGRVEWRRDASGWRFEGDRLAISRGEGLRLPSRVSLSWQRDAAAEAAGRLRLGVSFLRLDAFQDLLPLAIAVAPEEAETDKVSLRHILRILQDINPRGDIHDLRGVWQGGADGHFSAYARFEDLACNAWEKVPALSGASGQLWVESGRAQIRVARAAMQLILPQLFRAPLQVDYLSGDLAWRGSAADWQITGRNLLAGNEDIHTSMTLDLRKTPDLPSPFISLLGSFRDGNGRHVSRYLPTGILKKPTVDWLDHAIRDGFVPRGWMALHGRLSDFPYATGNGRFEVRFDVQDALLDYARDWPPIADIGAEVLFRGPGMEINAEHGRIFQSEIRWARIAIDNMRAKPLVVTVKGEISGATQEKLDYLNQSPPLRKKFGAFLDLMQARGDSLLSLDLSLPVQQTQDTRVSGTVKMEDNVLSVKPVGEVLGHVNGLLRFSSDGLRAEPMRVDLLGQPVMLNIAPGPAGQTRLRASGRFDAVDLSRRYLPQVSDLLEGSSDLEATLDVPMGGDTKTKAAVLRVKSSLQGVASRLPSPLAKAADELLPVKLRMDFPSGREPRLRLAYGGFLSGVFEFGEGGPLGLHRGELRFNSGAAQMPDQAGLRVAGWLDTFSLDDWGSILGGDGGKSASWVLSTDLAIREAEVFGQKLHNLKLKVTPQKREWQADVDSQELSGLIRIPRGDARRAFEAVLDYCRLDTLFIGGDDNAPLDPRRVPPLKVRIGDLRYKQLRYGGLSMETLPVHNGLKIKHFLLTPKDTRLTATGGWFVRDKETFSKFDIQVESDNVEETLRAFGYVDSIAGGKGTMKLSLQWPGSPAALLDSRALVRGRVEMNLRKGQLLDVDPGAGRLFGLLSVQALPRRLLLDFSDVFREGFSFDRLQGDFTIEDGDAYTSNLYMIGPAARVDITGRIGLVAQDYDQLVTVTPRISETLPLIGALALTPQIGAAILFVQKVMEPQINKATQVKYSITGPWTAPQIVKLKRPKVESSDSPFLDE